MVEIEVEDPESGMIRDKVEIWDMILIDIK